VRQEIKAFVFDAYGTLYDVQSVERAVEAAYPGYGSLVSAVWRIKQLEYTWLTSLMGRYEDFWDLTKRALEYTLRSLHLEADVQRVEDVAAAYLSLRPYDDARECLERLAPHKRAILSNGSPAMLSNLVKNSSFDRLFDRILSIDSRRVFKPAKDAYALVEQELGVKPKHVIFVSSNGFDICGGKNYGFTVVRVARSIDRVGTEFPLKIDERVFFDLLRAQAETLDQSADVTVRSLAEIPDLFGDHGRGG
jgi:2-haloacid dehalogenase